MRQIVATIAIAVMMVPHISLAEERLFITDVLDKKQVEAGITCGYRHYSHEISSESEPLNGDRSIDATYSGFSLNVGLGHGFEVGAWIPYVFSEETKVEFPTVPNRTYRFSADGFGDILLRGKYVIFDESDKPFSLVAGLDLKPDTASEEEVGTGTTNVMYSIAASTTFADDFRPFARYRFVARNHGAGDTHAFNLGAEKELSDGVAIEAYVDAGLHTSSGSFDKSETYEFVVDSYIRIHQNFYAVPAAVYGIGTPTDEKYSDRRRESAYSVKLAFGLYCLF